MKKQKLAFINAPIQADEYTKDGWCIAQIFGVPSGPQSTAGCWLLLEKTTGPHEPEAPKKRENPVSNEMAVGEVREVNGKRYRCVLAGDRDCPQCPFDCADGKCKWPCGDCASDYRKDKNHVIFEEVKEDEK